MATSKKIAEIILTPWDASWLDLINENVVPKLKGIRFEKHVEEIKIEGHDAYGNPNGTYKIFYGQSLIKIIIEADAEYFKNELKTGGFDNWTFLAKLESFIVHNFKYPLLRVRADWKEEENT